MSHLDIEKNHGALFYLLDRGEEQWKMTFGTSELAKKEIDRIKLEKDPEYYREKVSDLYLAFETLRGLSSDEFEQSKRENGLSNEEETALRASLVKARNCQKRDPTVKKR